jgi:integrase
MRGRLAQRDLSAQRALARFCTNQGLEALLAPEVIEAFVVGGLPGRAPWTKGTYRSALRAMADGPRPVLATPFPGSPAKAPYRDEERAELLSAALSARSGARRSSALAFLALGIGAGLRPGELVAARGKDVVATRDGVQAHVGTGRVVPVTGTWAKILARQAKEAGAGYLFRPGRAAVGSRNLVNGFGPKVAASPAGPRLSSGRARSSFVCDHLAAGTHLRQLLYVAGICEVESLLRYARHVPGAPSSKAELRARHPTVIKVKGLWTTFLHRGFLLW